MNSARIYPGLRSILLQISSDKDSSQSVMMKTHVHLDSDTCRAGKVLAQGMKKLTQGPYISSFFSAPNSLGIMPATSVSLKSILIVLRLLLFC